MRGTRAHRSRFGWLAGLCLALAVGATRAADKPPEEYLDEDTAATITVVAEPLVFAYERRDLAANARDYVTVAAAAVDRSGKITYVLVTYFWSTVDPRLRPDPLPSPSVLSLQADDRRIDLKLDGHSAHEAGIGRPVHEPPGSTVTPSVYRTDLATLRFLGESRHLKVLIDTETTVTEFPLWDDRRTALRSFVRHMSGED